MQIELDLTDAPVLDAPSQPGRRGEVPRWWWVVLVVAACGLLAGSAADISGVRVVARIPAGVGTFALDGDTVLVMRPTDVSAWDARTGRQRWSREVTDGTLWDTATSFGTAEVLSSAACITGAGTGVTAAVDRATGRELWRRPGIPLSVDGRVVLSSSSWSDRCDASRGYVALQGGLIWTAVNPITGAVNWQTSVPQDTVVAVDSQGGGWAALVDAQGGLSTVDLATGVRSAVVPHVTSGPIQLIAHGDDLVVAELTFQRQTVDATTGSHLGSGEDGNIPTTVNLTSFDPRTLARRWHTTVVADPSGFQPQYCGPYLCVDTTRTTALDPATGTVRWSVPLRGFSTAAGRLFSGPRLNGFTEGADPGIAIADPNTGQTVTTLPSWRLLGVHPPSKEILIGQVRPTRTLLGWLIGPKAEAFATVPAEVLYCQLDTTTIACQAGDQVWLLNRR